MATKRMIIKRQYILLALLTTFILTGCTETKTSDVNDTYKYWAGTNSLPNIELLNGQYWQSAHWTKEYIMYLKFKSTQTLWDIFLKENLISSDKDN